MKKYIHHNILCAIFGVLLLAVAGPQNASAGKRGLYIEEPYWNPSSDLQTRCHRSQFNTLFLFTMQVDANGALRFNDHYVVDSNGRWVGGNWNTRVAGCRGGSVSSIELCIGNWGTQSFNNIKNLIASSDPYKLRRHFTVLKQNMPTIDAMQMDDETTYDRKSMVAFCKMLTDVGFAKVTLCPYTNQTFWKGVKSDLGSRVSAVWLMCYDGGAGNVPSQWRTALGTSVLYPGEWVFTGKTKVRERMTGWRQEGFNGGFLIGTLPDSTWGQVFIDAGF
jgi:hypothetical protein